MQHVTGKFIRCASRVSLILMALVLISQSISTPSYAQGIQGGGEIKPPTQCVTQVEYEQADLAIADYVKRFGPLSTTSSTVAGGGVPDKFTFYPMGGKLWGDLFTTNFVDLDNSSGILDWDCTGYTYDGHDATDVILRSFGEQAIGVPIFAVLDGTVIATHDGEFDMNSLWCQFPPFPTANSVIIDHGNGRRCYYWHMKKNSIRVSVGQQVKAGEQIGDIGSSGCSTDPHLHFATYDNNGSTLTEPYAGPCNGGDSEWVNQTPIYRGLYLQDFNITDQNINGYPGMPFHIPRAGTFVMGLRSVYFWNRTGNLPAFSSWRVQLRKPDGTIQNDSGTNSFGNPDLWRWTWWWWGYSWNLNTVGTWHIVFSVNGVIQTEAPLEVVANSGDIVNRPPTPITVQIDPTAPTSDDVVICSVNTDLVLDDPDYDIVQYHYVWKVDGVVKRDVTTAALTDALQRHTAFEGSTVQCTVTPTDGIDAAGSASDSIQVQPGGLGIVAPEPPLPYPYSPGSAACNGGENYGLPCMVCDAGSRLNELCVTDGDCSGGVCLPNNLLCPDAFCGTAIAGAGMLYSYPNSRYIGFNPNNDSTWVGKELAVRVKMMSVEGFPTCNDEVRYAGSPVEYCEGGACATTFNGSQLQSTPHWMDWTTVGAIQLFGEEVVPGSRYAIQAIDRIREGDLAGEINYSTPALIVGTSKWGDVVLPLSAFSSASQPSIGDVLKIVDKWLGNLEPRKSRSQLQPALINPTSSVGIADVLKGVDAWLGTPYPFSITTCTP